MKTERLYYDDAFQKEFAAQLLSCVPAALSPGGGAPRWQVILDRTAFYPTSGGQPHDRGRLGVGKVIEVRDESETVLHLVDSPLERGEVLCTIDWPRRFDHMQQHTGQHLLSAVLESRFGWPTVSFHLGEEHSTIDLRGPQPQEETLALAERAVNQIICEDRPVTVRYGTAQELSRLGVRKQVLREGTLRAIEIEGVDLQPCGGTHVGRTGQIGWLAVRSCSKIRQDWRVEFLCGQRAETAARRQDQLLHQVADKFGCAPGEILAAAARALSDRDANFKKFSALVEPLAVAEAALALSSTSPDAEGVRVVSRVFEKIPAEFVRALAAELAKTEKTIALLCRRGCGHTFFAQHPSAEKEMSALLKQVLEKAGGKGGGTRDFARGQLADPSRAEYALSLAREILEAPWSGRGVPAP